MNLNLEFLRIPLYMLARMSDEELNAFDGLAPEQVARLPRDYSEEECQGLVEALRFARANPDHPYAGLAWNGRFTNAQLHAFLCKVLASIERVPR